MPATNVGSPGASSLLDASNALSVPKNVAVLVTGGGATIVARIAKRSQEVSDRQERCADASQGERMIR